ncbi:hypothetical protein AVEN_230158-1 [Araneus ventricosus]|uniref:Uncharacterized protein n=1 Tax=Araneus ventricosus TaxID=182803 RepID=A0A4Y2RTF7_ARAVE|nr:hypothetical protein AVEN_230158-1 [Araneus ventricosus]
MISLPVVPRLTFLSRNVPDEPSIQQRDPRIEFRGEEASLNEFILPSTCDLSAMYNLFRGPVYGFVANSLHRWTCIKSLKSCFCLFIVGERSEPSNSEEPGSKQQVDGMVYVQ